MRFGQFQISTEFFFSYAFLNFGKILVMSHDLIPRNVYLMVRLGDQIPNLLEKIK